MKFNKKYWLPIFIFLLGLIIPLNDFAFIFIGMSILFISPILLFIMVCLLLFTYIGFEQKDKKILFNVKIGFLSLLMLICAPVISIIIADKLYEIQVNYLRNQIENYKFKKGQYPSHVNEIDKPFYFLNIKYSYDFAAKNFSLEYKPRALVNIHYNNATKEFENF
ncbi:MAG: hypothetical protein EOP53_15350 [Sphingobacteriales bacterium]|nr:MAG: hypothetical protein EOP53_15350 [Sphingobacteriales bacterium]